MSDRVLWFPDDVAVGFLEASIGEAVVARGPARGRVRVPAGAAVHLWVRCPVRGLGLLHADDVDSVRITPAAPQSLKNGSDVAGSWEMRYLSDAGGMGATMDLHRDGSKVAGTWSGPLGEGRPISGTWRDGYIELSFAGSGRRRAGRARRVRSTRS